jgi:hypothetical protein
LPDGATLDICLPKETDSAKRPRGQKSGPTPEETGMTYDEASEALLEKVLGALTRANGDNTALMGGLGTLDDETRALALIQALLSADATIAATFTDAERDRDLARAAARTLVRQADRIEADTPELAPVRLSLLRGAARTT